MASALGDVEEPGAHSVSNAAFCCNAIAVIHNFATGRRYERTTKEKGLGGIVMRSKTYDGIPASYLLAFHRCPKCNEEVFAAEGASLVPAGVRFEWSCDLCGHRFETDEAVAA